jgi:hypothetical protein
MKTSNLTSSVCNFGDALDQYRSKLNFPKKKNIFKAKFNINLLSTFGVKMRGETGSDMI